MTSILILNLLIIIIPIIDGQWDTIPQQQQQRVLRMNHLSYIKPTSFMQNTRYNRFMFQNDMNTGFRLHSNGRIPFPECLSTEAAATLFSPSSLQNVFLVKLEEENRKLKQERVLNNDINNNDIMDFDAVQLRSDARNGALIARVATKVAEHIITELSCQTNATITAQLDDFLRKVRMPAELCAFHDNANCDGLTEYRTITGVCNNLQRPYDGSSQTAFTRLLPAAYHDGLSKPRSESVLGGPLPSCRQISLAMGSKPIFDTSFNNLFVSYGQFVVHDMTLATPVTDAGRTPISSCGCSSEDHDMCNVIDINTNDPFMSEQKCMAMPASAQAFTDQICSLGVKDQMNGNSHYIDLSTTYGSTKATALSLRTGKDGLLKTMKRAWSKFDLPPGQREGKSCTDSTTTHKCFAAGDSRLMENILLSGIQTQWLRAHNIFAGELASIRPDWRSNDNILYEEARKILSGLHQHYIYDEWLPILIGKEKAQQYVGDNGLFSIYNPTMRGIVFNEAATAVLRLHTLVRDLYSRCKPNGKLIDQVWLHDVNAKCNLAYDAQNNGVDSFLCGSLFDYGFSGDTNYAQEIHHRLFETKDGKGHTRRHDIVSINICRAREHGIPGYNSYRQLCGLRRAVQFQDFADVMSPEAVDKLSKIYNHVEDVDLFVGVNHENHLPGALVGPVSACIIGTQFRHLKYGDRLFYTHEGQFTPEQILSIKKYSYNCFICHTTDIEKVPLNPFRPPNDMTNPLGLCSQCPLFEFDTWRLPSRYYG